ncbi:MAG: hypothetical protein V1909_01365 [Candidatus Micrarchaeota archaeon]
MRLKTALLATELVFTVGMLFFTLIRYVTGAPVPKEIFVPFVFYPLSILATVVALSYYVSVKFGKSIIAYGIVLGLGVSLSIFAVRVLPPILTLGLALYIINRMLIMMEYKEIKQVSADLLAENLISFQIASLVVLALTQEYVSILDKGVVSPILFAIIISWYLFTLINEMRSLANIFRKWSRSEPG